MDCGRTVEGSLDALVSGKRASRRHMLQLDAVVKAVRGTFQARLLDVSQDGARVSIPIESLGGEPGTPLGPAEQFGLLEGHFRDSFDIHIPSRGVVIEAHVVRLVVTADLQDELELGCRFVQTLTEKQQGLLGILQPESDLLGWGEATLLHDLNLVAKAARPVSALLVDESEGTRGPLCVGPIPALGKRALIVRLWGRDSSEIAGALQGPGVRARILLGSKTLHETPAASVAVRYIDTPEPGVEVLLACGDVLPRAVRKHFKKA